MGPVDLVCGEGSFLVHAVPFHFVSHIALVGNLKLS